MKSAVATSYELDDAAKAARQLAGSVRDSLAPMRHSVGLLFCDADADGAALTGELKRLLDMDVVGMTTLAALDSGGRHEAAAVFLVLSADDCEFRAAVSGPLAAGDHERAISSAYESTVPAAGDGGPGLIFAFCPSGMPFSGDSFPAALSRASGGAPIMGGAASDDYDYARARVFFSGSEHRDAMALVSLWGQVRPVFAIRHVTSRFAERTRRITSASGNIVHSVGDETFVRYLEGFGLKTDVPDPLLAFTSYPMMLTLGGNDETPLMRHISGLDPDAGSGMFFGDVPVGAQANICLINKNDIMESCRASMHSLLEEAALRPDRASTVLCISCCGRSMILGADANAEGKILAEMLPTGMALAGAYCLGEICPTSYREGIASSRFHNCSITFCML
jgi:hypothetical protein